MNNPRAVAVAVVLAAAPLARAEVPSVLGGKMMPGGTTAHHVGLGIPGIFYEWRQGGWDTDWGIHAGMIYEDWSGTESDVDLGLEVELPIRIRLGSGDAASTALRLAPGVLLGDRNDSFVLGIRGDVGALVTVEVHQRANLVTGVTAPVTVLLNENLDSRFIVPVLGRIGLESFWERDRALSLLLEVGPAFGEGVSDERRFAARFWLGFTFYD